MSSKKKFELKKLIGGHGSIAFRLTGWYALLSVALIAVAGSILYWVLAGRLRQEDDQWLVSRLTEVRGILQLHSHDSTALKEEIHRAAAMLPGSYLSVIDSHGLNASGGTLPNVGTARGPFAGSFTLGEEKGENWTSAAGDTYRLMSARENIGAGYTIHVAMDRTNEEEVLAAYRRILWLALSVSLATAIVAGYLIARHSLRPVARLATMIAELGASQLNQRAADQVWPTELTPLASNFDQLLARLDESFARISRFSADIAHELRTPLHILQGEAQSALSKTRSNEEYRQCIESATEEHERLARMVDALLFLSRTEQPESVPDKQLLDIKSEIAAICAFYQALADEQETRLIARGSGMLLADSDLLRRALGNLINNALRHTSSGGCIAVDVKRADDQVVAIEVSDTGEGISSDDLVHVFDRFYRADSARLRNGTGSGLGLAIVRSIMQLHGGSITLVSEPGRGTTATLRFPALQ